MRLPRLTTRRLMVLVALAGVSLGTGLEVSRRLRRSIHYAQLEIEALGETTLGLQQARLMANSIDRTAFTPSLSSSRAELSVRSWHRHADRNRARAAWANAMRRKYRFAAFYPWLPVAPDPPEPK